MFKKTIVILLVVSIFVSVFAISVSAYGISTCDISSATKSSTLSISGTKATCFSKYLDGVAVAKVTITQSLEKHSFLWSWDTVGGSWTKTETNAVSVTFTNTKSGLTSGTYRVKSVFTVTLSNGTSETVTVYSNEVEI